MNANIPGLFRSYQSHETDSGCKIWEAALATFAVPTFFKHMKIGTKQLFIDGGLGYYNPSKMLLKEAKVMFSTHQIGCLLSIGTGHTKVIGINKPGVFLQSVPMDVIDTLNTISTDCEATHDDISHLFAPVPNKYFRLNVEQEIQDIRLSEWEEMAIVEAYTMQYLKRRDVAEKLSLLIHLIKASKAEQFGMKQFVISSNLDLTSIILVSSRPPQYQPFGHLKISKICPLPVKFFIGRKEILHKMHQYFNSGHKSQHVFVLHGLGGSGKSQVAYKFLEDAQTNQWYVWYYQICSEYNL